VNIIQENKRKKAYKKKKKMRKEKGENKVKFEQFLG